MSYYDNEERRAMIEEHIKKLRDIAGLYPLIMPIIRDFDNKVYNIRFKKALSDACSGTGRYVCSEKRYKYIEIYIYDRGSQYTLAQCAIDDMPDGKRIPADKLLESARKKRAQLLKDAYALENTDISQTLKQLNNLISTYNTIYDSLPWEFRSVYGINHI